MGGKKIASVSKIINTPQCTFKFSKICGLKKISLSCLVKVPISIILCEYYAFNIRWNWSKRFTAYWNNQAFSETKKMAKDAINFEDAAFKKYHRRWIKLAVLVQARFSAVRWSNHLHLAIDCPNTLEAVCGTIRSVFGIEGGTKGSSAVHERNFFWKPVHDVAQWI